MTSKTSRKMGWRRAVTGATGSDLNPRVASPLPVSSAIAARL